MPIDMSAFLVTLGWLAFVACGAISLTAAVMVLLDWWDGLIPHWLGVALIPIFITISLVFFALAITLNWSTP